MKIGNLNIFFIILLLSLNSKAELINGHKVNVSILDKITSKISNTIIDVNDNYIHGSLKIEIFACYKKPPEEIPEDLVLLRVFDNIDKGNAIKIFQGWMISSSPSATPFEHPIYDIWVNDCLIKKNL